MVEIKQEHVEKFVKLARSLDRLMEHIKDYCPDAMLYLAMEDLNLLRGPSHTQDGEPLQENIVESVRVDSMSGGDW